MYFIWKQDWNLFLIIINKILYFFLFGIETIIFQGKAEICIKKKKNHMIFDSYLGLHFLTLYAGMSNVKMAIFEVCLSLVGHRYCICHMIEPQRAHVF